MSPGAKGENAQASLYLLFIRRGNGDPLTSPTNLDTSAWTWNQDYLSKTRAARGGALGLGQGAAPLRNVLSGVLVMEGPSLLKS